MADLDALVRGAAIGIALLFAVALVRAKPSSSHAWTGALYAAGAIAYLVWGDASIAGWPRGVRAVIGILALSCPFFFWALARSIFEDDFQIRGVHWLVLATIIVAGVGQSVLPGSGVPWLVPALAIGFRVLSLALVLHVFWLIWAGRRADLVETRAHLRIAFLICAGTGCALVLLAALLYAPVARRPAAIRLGEAVAILALNLTFGAALLRLDRDFLPANQGGALLSPSPVDAADTKSAAQTGGAVDPDANVLARLDQVMRHDAAWRETGLSIGALAAQVAVPEYRLRRLINQRLGFRNFTAFVNEYRLAAAAERLADPKELRTPVLTIALDLGWGPIGPVEQAVRARFDMTPQITVANS